MGGLHLWGPFTLCSHGNGECEHTQSSAAASDATDDPSQCEGGSAFLIAASRKLEPE